METQTHPIELLVEKAEQYAKANIELYRLKTIERSADVISTLVSKLIIISSFTLFFMILNIGIALWIGDLFGITYFGFFIVAFFYALVGSILFAFRNKWIKTPMKNSIIIQALN